MTDTLALEALYDAVVARFAAEGTVATNAFGWRAPAQQQVDAARVAWIPGDDRSGAAGNDGPARSPGRTASLTRPIATYNELFTVIISARDPSAPEDERAQYKATRLLRDAWHRAVYLAAHGTFTIQSEQWIVDKKERRAGAAMRVLVSLQAKVPDSPLTSAPVDTAAAIDVIELDVTETDNVTP